MRIIWRTGAMVMGEMGDVLASGVERVPRARGWRPRRRRGMVAGPSFVGFQERFGLSPILVLPSMAAGTLRRTCQSVLVMMALCSVLSSSLSKCASSPLA